MSEQVAEAEATEGFASTAEVAAGAAEAAAAAEGPGALALFGEAALGTAAGMGAAAGGLAVAGGAAALVGTAWALHGGMVAAEHLMDWLSLVSVFQNWPLLWRSLWLFGCGGKSFLSDLAGTRLKTRSWGLMAGF